MKSVLQNSGSGQRVGLASLCNLREVASNTAKFFVFALLSLGVVLTAGCSSIESNKLTIGSDGKVTKESVGGLPIVVQTPKQLVFIATVNTYEVFDIAIDDQGVVVKKLKGTTTEVSIDKTPILVGPYELFTVDIKRPMFGTLDYKLELENQYPKKIEGKIDDKTLGQILPFIEKLIAPTPLVTKQSGELSRELTSTKMKLIVFDLSTGDIKSFSP